MNAWQKEPFFGRPLVAAGFHATLATLLTVVVFADVLLFPPSRLVAGRPAPVTYRQTTTGGEEQAIVVERGQRIEASEIARLEQYLAPRAEFQPAAAAGVALFYFVAMALYNLVLAGSRQKRLLRFRALASQALALLAVVVASRLLLSLTTLNSFACPVAFAALLFATCLPVSQALALHLLAVALVAPMLGLSRGIMLVPLATGWAAVMLVKRESGPWRVLLAALAGGLAGGAVLLGLELFNPGQTAITWDRDGQLLGLGISMAAAGLAAALLLYPLTGLFGQVSTARLRRLLELDHPLLKDLSDKAPGTFQHSLALANLAEKVAEDVDADGDLVRAGAYYHDIGKMLQPEQFIENQHEHNPHDELAPQQSAALLRQHISNGVRLARAAHLPERIIDFIIEHHGRSIMEYFHDKAVHNSPAPPRLEDFRYDGRNPTSRETAILMIADSVEAASRTLHEPNPADVMRLVRQILFDKLLAGLLDDSGLTTGDLKRIGRSMVAYLLAQYHLRVPYPWQRSDGAPGSRMQTDPALRVATPRENEDRGNAAPGESTSPEPAAET